MTKQDALDALLSLSREEQIQWLIDLGMNLTVSARASYPFQEEPGSLLHLVGFNEIQHQVYNRIRHLALETEWAIENFLDGLMGKARYYEIEGDFGWALKSSLAKLQK
jgi:hypothetical protein